MSNWKWKYCKMFNWTWAETNRCQYPYLPCLIISDLKEKNDDDDDEDMTKYIKKQEKIADINKLLIIIGCNP